MVDTYSGPVVKDKLRPALVETKLDLSDQQLLQRFLIHHDQSAFADLVERHGRTVWGVCRRALVRAHDAEDAFQAAFLILARKAASIRKGEAVGSWLYGVAYRTAMKARQRAARRQDHEQAAASQGRKIETPEGNSPWGEAACRELQRMLDEEVQLLPEKYRTPFVLCCLEGLSKTEAAQELGWKEGTVSGRLARARQHLQKRLARRGVVLSAVLTAMALAQSTASAAAPPVLVATTAQAVLPALAGQTVASALSPSAVALADGVVKTLVAAKLKAGICLAVAVTTLAGGATFAVMQQAPPQAKVEQPAPVVQVFEPDIFRAPPSPVFAAIDEQVLTTGFSNDGKRLITAGARYTLPGQLKIWGVESHKLLATVKGIPGVRSLAVSPHGDIFATGDFGGFVKLRDGTSGAELKSVRGHTVGVNGVAFSADGKQLVSAGLDKILKVWDAEDLKEKKILLGHTEMIYCVAFFKHGGAIVSGGKDKSARIWDLTTGKEKFILEGHREAVESVAVSPDDSIVATTSWDGSIRLWDAATGKQTAVFDDDKLERPAVFFIAFSPDGSLLAGADGSVRLYDVKTQKLLSTLGRHNSTTWSVAFSKDGKTLASGSSDKTAKLWNVAERKEIATLNTGELKPIQALAYAPDGKVLAIATEDKTIQVRDAKTGDITRTLSGHSDIVTCLAFSADGQTLASGSADKTVKLWEWPSGKERVTLKNHSDVVHAVHFTRDGKLLSAGEDKIIRLFDPTSDKETATFHGHEAGVYALAVSPDGDAFASGGIDNTIRVWDFAKQNSVTLRGHVGAIRALAYSAQGVLASAGEDTTVKLWEPGKLPTATADGKLTAERAALRGHRSEVTALAFTPAGRTLVSASLDGSIMVWDAIKGQPRTILRGHNGPIAALAMHPQGFHVISGGHDAKALRWQAATMQAMQAPPGPPPRTLQGNPGGVWFAAFSPANDLLATGGAGGSVTLWSRALVPNQSSPIQPGIQPGIYWDVAASPDARTFAVARGTELVVFDGGNGRVRQTIAMKKILRSVTFSRDGKYLSATGGHWEKPNIPYEATIFDAATGKKLVTLEGHKGVVYRAVFAPDGKTVATSSLDQTIRIWEFPSGKFLGFLKGHESPAKGIAFLPDGTLVTASWDKTIRFWDVTKLKQVKVWQTDMKMASLDISSDGTMFAAAGEPFLDKDAPTPPAVIRVWDIQSGKELLRPQGHQGHVLGLAFTRDGRGLVAAGGKLSAWGEVSHWDLTTGQLRASVKAGRQWFENVAVGMNDQRVLSAAAGSLNFWDFEFAHNQYTWKAHDNIATCGIFADDGKILVTSGADGSIKLWDASKKPTLIGSLNSHKDYVRGLALLPGGKTLVSVSEDKTIKLWDLAAKAEKATLSGHNTGVLSVAVSPDGKTLATGGGDRLNHGAGELILWDLEAGKPRKTIAGIDKTVWSLAISPDGRQLAASVANNTVQIFNIATGDMLATLSVPFARPVAFSLDGKFLAIGHGKAPSITEPGNGLVRIYETGAWKLQSNTLPHNHVIFQIAFAPDGRTLASASQDGTIKLTSYPTGSVQTTAIPVGTYRTMSPLGAKDVRQALQAAGAPQSQVGVTQTETQDGASSGISTKVWLALAIAGFLFFALGFAWARSRRAANGNGKTSGRAPLAAKAAKPGANSAFVSFSCPHCGKGMQAKAEFGGRMTRCPRCGTKLPIPSQAGPAARG